MSIDERAGEPSNGVTRRTAVAAAVWSIPVIAVAAATPSAVASPGGGGGATPTLLWVPTSITVSQSRATLIVNVPAGWDGVGKGGYLVVRGAPYYNVRTISAPWAPRLTFPNVAQAYFPDSGESRLPAGRFVFVVEFPVWSPEDAGFGSASCNLTYWDPSTSSSVIVPGPGLPFIGY